MKMDIKGILNKKPNKRLILIIGILAVSMTGLGLVLSGRGIAAETAAAERGDIQKYVEEIGEVKCKDAVTVYIEGNGLIGQIEAEENQQVRKGELLLSMDREQLELSRQNAVQALNRARAEHDAGEEDYQTALKDYNNTKYLAEEGAVSQWDLTQKEAELKRAEAALSGYQAALEQAEVSVESDSLALGKQEILSPTDGTVLERMVEVNEIGAPGTAAFVIGDLENIEIESKILAEDAADIKVGDKAVVTARTEDKQEIEGSVVKVAPTAEDEVSSLGVRQKKVTVTIKPIKNEASLIPGYEADVRIVTEKKKGVIIVPSGAVFDYKGESCIFTIEKGKAVLRTVKTGIRNESFIEITEGLAEGEIVLSSPDNSIEEGMRINTSDS